MSFILSLFLYFIQVNIEMPECYISGQKTTQTFDGNKVIENSYPIYRWKNKLVTLYKIQRMF